MRIISEGSITAYAAKHASAATSLDAWIRITRLAQWTCAPDVLRTFPNAKVLNGERVRFSIGGNAFRLVAAMHFPSRGVWIKFIGTHAEYDKIDALTVDTYRSARRQETAL